MTVPSHKMTPIQALKNVIEAWESLPGGQSYSAREIGIWLEKAMKPAMDNARKSLKLSIPKKKRFLPYDCT